MGEILLSFLYAAATEYRRKRWAEALKGPQYNISSRNELAKAMHETDGNYWAVWVELGRPKMAPAK